MKKQSLLFFCLLLIAATLFSQNPAVVVPSFNDDYCNTVKKLEAGQVTIDYKKFRESFLQSEQFKVASGKTKETKKLTDQLYEQMKTNDYPALIKSCKELLSIDYTNMRAHKILRQTYAQTGDSILASRYKQIQFGLLNSIVKNGDGKTCATGWPVIQIAEEYFILEMVGAKLNKQSVDQTGGLCDKMEVSVDGQSKTYYFDVTKVFEGYKKLGMR